MELGFIAAAVRRYAWMVVVCAVLGLGAALLVAKSSDPDYTSTSVILVLPPSNASGSLFDGDPDRYVDAEVSTMNSAAVLKLVLAELPDETEASLADTTTFTTRSNSDIVEITTTTSSPQRSQDIANAYADGYMEYVTAQVETASQPSAELEAVNAQLADLEVKLADLTQKIRDALPPGAIDLSQSDDALSIARRDATLLEYQRLLQTKTRLEENAQVQLNSAIIDRAGIGVPEGVRTRFLLAIGLVGGLGVGVGAALLRARFSSELIDPAQVDELLGRPIAGHLPRVRGLSWDTASLLDAVPDDMVEPLERVCVGVQSASTDDKLRVAVTGTIRGIGASSLSVAIAGRFARRGSATFLVDADAADPWLSEVFGTAVASGLSDLLPGHAGHRTDGGATLAAHSTATMIPELRVVGVGEFGRDHGLRSADVPSLLRALDQPRSVQVIDAGPILESAAALEIARRVDAVVVLMPRLRQESWQLSAIAQSLEDSRVLVVPVVTAARRTTPGPMLRDAADSEEG